MSKLGRRKKNAYQGRKKALREMIEGLVFLALALFFCVGILMEEYSTEVDLKAYTGIFREVETRRTGPRMGKHDSYRIIFEDGNVFFVHGNFRKDEFLDIVSLGDELHILAADIRRPLSISGDLNGVVFELRTADGQKLRDYDSTATYLKEMQEMRIIWWGLICLCFVAMSGFAFRDWRRYKAKCAEIEAKNKYEIRKHP